MFAKDYIKFLDLLWRRVRPDLLFPPPPLPEGEKPPPIFSTTVSKGDGSISKTKGKKAQRGRGVRGRGAAAAAAAASLSYFPTTARGVLGNAGFGRETAYMRFYGRPPPPLPAPPPRTPIGLLALQVPGFRLKEAQRAAWVRRGSLIDPEMKRLARPAVDLVGTGGGDRSRGSTRPEQDLGQGEGEEPSWKQRRRKRLLAAGVVEEREGSNGRPGVGWAGRKFGKQSEEMDSVWDFAARSFPIDPREVSGGGPCDCFWELPPAVHNLFGVLKLPGQSMSVSGPPRAAKGPLLPVLNSLTLPPFHRGTLLSFSWSGSILSSSITAEKWTTVTRSSE